MLFALEEPENDYQGLKIKVGEPDIRIWFPKFENPSRRTKSRVMLLYSGLGFGVRVRP